MGFAPRQTNVAYRKISVGVSKDGIVVLAAHTCQISCQCTEPPTPATQAMMLTPALFALTCPAGP